MANFTRGYLYAFGEGDFFSNPIENADIMDEGNGAGAIADRDKRARSVITNSTSEIFIFFVDDDCLTVNS